MENPFDLRGPQFLLFFFCLGIAVTLLMRRIRMLLERGDEPRPLSDYLEIAYLRGGADEAIRVATLTLIDRGALTISGDSVKAADRGAAHRVSKDTERAIVAKAAHPARLQGLVSASDVKAAADAECRPELRRRGLLPTAAHQAVRFVLWLAAFGTVALVAWNKIQIALDRGRTNIEYLVLLTGLFFVVTLVVAYPRRTPAGDALVEDLRTLFAGLKDRAKSFRPREGGSDFALLAAVYGVGLALPVYPSARGLFPKASASSDSSGGSSCGSSCGSSGGSSCGSSCGGGGGGCGGCGS